MKTLQALAVLVVLALGGYVLYLILPPFFGNFKLGRMMEDQAVVYTYQKTSNEDIAAAIAERAKAFDVPLAPEQVLVTRTPGDLQISAEYTVHVENPIYPFDLNFKAETKNHNVMK
jgi:hypothetical protein